MDKAVDSLRWVAGGVRSGASTVAAQAPGKAAQVQGAAGHALEVGRHAWNTKVLHRVEASNDPLFDTQRRNAARLEGLLTDIDRRFASVASMLQSVGVECEALVSSLGELRRLCDVDGSERHCRSVEDATAVATLDAEVARAASQLSTVFTRAGDTVRGACGGIAGTSLAALKEDSSAARRDVREAQLAYDNARSDLVAAEQRVAAASAESEQRGWGFLGGSSVSQPAPGRALGPEAAREMLELDRRRAAVAAAAETYTAAVASGHERYAHAFQQLGMGVWASYNVFFASVATCAADSAEPARTVATSLQHLKNTTHIAKQLTEERRVVLQGSQPPSASTTPAQPPAVAPVDQQVTTQVVEQDAPAPSDTARQASAFDELFGAEPATTHVDPGRPPDATFEDLFAA